MISTTEASKTTWLRRKLFRPGQVMLCLCLAAVLSLFTPGVSHAQQLQSLRSANFLDRFIRHRNLLGYVEKVAPSDTLGRRDGTFRIVPGLAGRCNSFESLNYRGHFLRHQNFRMKLAKFEGTRLFRDDATFCMVAGLAGDGTSFESLNFPSHYIRHFNFELWLSRFERQRQFMKDATFYVVAPITREFPGTFRGDTVLIPAEEEEE